jgi:cytochrome c oxidase assembly protein subunit 11
MGPLNLPPAQKHRSSGFVALLVAAASLAMLGLSFAAVPLYRLFCSATGFGGTPRAASVAPLEKGQRDLTVRFDANVAPGLSWKFAPETSQIKLRTGRTATVYFKASNESGHETAARAVFNVSPDSAGAYFNKIACFCFDEQRLGPGETREMPVLFYLDPALEQDAAMGGVQTITLSYTFFALKAPRGEKTAEAQERKRDVSPP